MYDKLIACCLFFHFFPEGTHTLQNIIIKIKISYEKNYNNNNNHNVKQKKNSCHDIIIMTICYGTCQACIFIYL